MDAAARIRALVHAHSANRRWSLHDLASAVNLSLTTVQAVVEDLVQSGDLDPKGGGYTRPLLQEEGR